LITQLFDCSTRTCLYLIQKLMWKLMGEITLGKRKPRGSLLVLVFSFAVKLFEL
jgi:hypothetical protein